MRYTTFSSSAIHNLMSKGKGNFSIENVGKPFYTYVAEKVMEIDLGQQLSKEHSARSTTWGLCVEKICFDKMGFNYKLISKTRFYHGKFKKYWSGMPDLLTDLDVGDIKCPYTLKSFCTLVKNMKDIEVFKKEHSDYYWQLVSNGILTGKDEALLVVYCPYLEDLPKVRERAESFIGTENNKFSWISWAEDGELPYLIKGNKYKDINIMSFTIPEEDKKILTDRVKMAIKELKKGL